MPGETGRPLPPRGAHCGWASGATNLYRMKGSGARLLKRCWERAEQWGSRPIPPRAFGWPSEGAQLPGALNSTFFSRLPLNSRLAIAPLSNEGGEPTNLVVGEVEVIRSSRSPGW
jgi:hypothetical protein